jgi:hypothetical protein
MRNEQGKFVKGTSGNPLGRPRIILTVRDIAREHTEEAIETLAAIMRDEVAPAAARISACTELLNRGHGRPVDQRAMLMIGAQLNSDRPVRLICPLLGGPKYMLFWTRKEKTNAI